MKGIGSGRIALPHTTEAAGQVARLVRAAPTETAGWRSKDSQDARACVSIQCSVARRCTAVRSGCMVPLRSLAPLALLCKVYFLLLWLWLLLLLVPVAEVRVGREKGA